ncbi:fungal-specific transcription factor domain-containing protein [Favolaschia claudopus]|uniref:Polynucleotide 5'-hydroxyl-kinase GRC3 n=1 Tax=Favolaschia claudopus TaxID=2862362 RepID=A0AAV9ZUR7_9AGAR
MSSNDEQDAGGHSKKRRIQRNRACDVCRKKKIRCDGPDISGPKCSNCNGYNLECTYVETSKKRGPSKGYIDSMAARVQKLEQLLQTLLPAADLEKALSGSAIPSLSSPVEDDERAQFSLIENLQQLSLNTDSDPRFFGRSSGAMLLQTALNIKNEAEPPNTQRHEEFWASRPSPDPTRPPQYSFPPPDLQVQLVDLFFSHVNLLLPLLHYPTFARDVAAGLHLTNDGFAATYLLVCAIGSRFSSDPRVLLDGTDNPHSCGWRWFQQLQLMRDPLGPTACLYDLQFSALLVLFLHGTAWPQAGWTAVSVGIRMAQDVGAHRRKDPTLPWTAEDELWKRAFWVLVYLDRVLSKDLGRPCAIQDEDFDLDFPLDVDDEYWETPDPAQAFQQPKGKPSRISAFIAHLRLCQVCSFALRTVYAINKSKYLFGLSNGDDSEWERHIITELDSALDKWVNELPDHLRWNPKHENLEFFEQSASLYCSYYELQVLIHRAYLPSPSRSQPLTNLKDSSSNNLRVFRSLGICLNAARSLIHVADFHRQRLGEKPVPLSQVQPTSFLSFSSDVPSQVAVFTAGLVLLLNIWGALRGGPSLSADARQEMAEVHRCMQVLQICEARWKSAGRLWDLLYDLASIGELPLPTAANAKNKRERGAEEPKSVAAARRHSESIAGPSGSAPIREALRQSSANSSEYVAVGSGTAHPANRPIAGRRPLPTDVPAINTQFLPQPQHSSPSYYQKTPLSGTSLHSPDKFAMAMHGDDPPRFRPSAPGPETPLSGTLHHGRPLEIYIPPQPPLSSASAPPSARNAPLSTPPIQPPIFVPSMNPSEFPHATSHTPLSAPQPLIQNHPQHSLPDDSRIALSHPPSANRDWYRHDPTLVSDIHDSRRRSIHMQPPEPSVPVHHTPQRFTVPSSAGPSPFPMSETFYEQMTASFTSPPHRAAALYVRADDYPDSGRTLHRIPSNMSIHSNSDLVHGHVSAHQTEMHPHHGDMDMWTTAPAGYDQEISMLSAIQVRKAAQAASAVPTPPPEPPALPSSPEQLPTPSRPSSKRKSSSQAPNSSRKRKKKREAELKKARYFEVDSDLLQDAENVIIVDTDDEEQSESDPPPAHITRAVTKVFGNRAWSPSAPMNDSSDEEDDIPVPSTPVAVNTTFRAVADQNVYSLEPEELSAFGLSGDAASLIGLSPGQTVGFFGAYMFTVLQGAVSICGVRVAPNVRPHRVYAPRSSPIPIIEALNEKLPLSLGSAVAPRLKSAFEHYDTVVVLQPLDGGVEGLGRICRTFDTVFRRSRFQDADTNPVIRLPGVHLLTEPSRDVQPFILPSSWETAFNSLSPSDTGVYLVKGHKNSGKSTFARTLLNRLLCRYRRVAFLECDLGQSEFTPGGMVALNVIERPVFGPPFTHPTLPNFAHYLGATSPRSSPSHYLASIQSLLETYQLEVQSAADNNGDSHISNVIPLVVNTMGWTKGLGADLTRKIEDLVQPTDIFQVEAPLFETFSSSEQSFGVSPDTQARDFKMHRLQPIPPSILSTNYSASDHRSIALVTATTWNTALPMCAQPPYEVDWDLAFDRIVLVGAGAEDVVSSEIARVLNGGLVGLVAYEPGSLDANMASTSDEESGLPSVPYIQGAEAPSPSTSMCHGVALIRAVSPSSSHLHILTPLPAHLLAKCRVVVKGEMELPIWEMLDFRTDMERDVAGVEKGKVPYLQWGKGEGLGGERRRVRRNLMRKGQM